MTLLKPWENTMLSVEDRLAAALGEIDRLHERYADAIPVIAQDAFERGFRSVVRYNDGILNSVEAAWEDNKEGILRRIK